MPGNEIFQVHEGSTEGIYSGVKSMNKSHGSKVEKQGQRTDLRRDVFCFGPQLSALNSQP
jgi:hypothetical protein